jgi:predicted RNase H-like HicB family nuclease
MQKRNTTTQGEVATAAGTKYLCRFEVRPEGGYMVSCPALPSVAAYGKTLAEARAYAREEIGAWEAETERLRAHFRAVCYTQDL